MRFKGILIVCAAALSALVSAAPAQAQSSTLVAPPIRLPLDENGVNLSTGEYVPPSSAVGIGGALGLSHSRYRVANGWRHNYQITALANSTTASVNIGGGQETFTKSGAVYVSDQDTGATMDVDLTSGIYTYTGSNGTQIRFDEAYLANNSAYYGANTALADQIISPNGLTIELQYRKDFYEHTVGAGRGGSTIKWYYTRLQSVTSNTGYMLKFDYQIETMTGLAHFLKWQRITRVTAINAAEEYCNPDADSCSLTGDWPYLDYWKWGVGSTESITDILGRETTVAYDGTNTDLITGIRRPTENAASETGYGVAVAYDGNDRVSSVTYQSDQSGGYERTYSWTTGSGIMTSVSDDTLGRTRTVITDTNIFAITSDTNDVGQETTYEYDSSTGQLDAVELPDGQRTQYTYDARGNVTEVRRIDDSGTSSSSDIVTSADYLGTCSNTVICNQPTSTTDATDQVTNYTYNPAHGGVTMVQLPAPDSGSPTVRPTIEFTYDSYNAKFKNSSGTMVAFSDAVTLPEGTTRCRTAATCTSDANEQVTELAYDNTAMPNLAPVSVTTELGDSTLTATTALTYDHLSNVLTVDGPDSGTADMSYNIYDDAGEAVGAISADPDGGGSQPRLAQRITRNEDGQVLTAETGTVTGTDLSSFSADLHSETEYDAYGRVVLQRQNDPSGTAQHSVVQFEYDIAGRRTCTALRMNAPLTTTTLEEDACVAMTMGSDGPDRITQNVYDTLDRVTEVHAGVGTTLAQITQEFSYLDSAGENGQLEWVEDAENNRTTYIYDDFGRRYRTNFPHLTTTGTSSTSDYDQVTFDIDGRVSDFRTRAGESFGFNYDDLGRLIWLEVPDRSGLAVTHTRDVYYGYDLFGGMEYARFNSASGEGINNTYNALGQLLSSENDMDGADIAVSYTYDVAGRPSRITHDDGVYFEYSYDALGRLALLEDQPGNDLFAWSFDNDGRLDGLAGYASAPDTSFTYDTAGRLEGMFNDHPTDPAYDIDYDWSFNPAGQIAAEVRDNNTFAFGDHEDFNIDYLNNGLNQITSLDSGAGAMAYTYGSNGNLTSYEVGDVHGDTAIESSSFIYDTENRMVGATIATPSGDKDIALRYDPLGRLYEVTDSSTDEEEETTIHSVRRLYYAGDALIAEYAASGTMLDRYVHGLSAGDDPLIAYDGSSAAIGNAQFLYRDRRGSIVAGFDSAGASTAINAYDEYGAPDESNSGRFQYTGQAWVPELGMFYYKARMYSPMIGRFMQTDPIGYGDGMNMYAYVGGDPVNGIDPTGMLECPVNPKDLEDPKNAPPSPCSGGPDIYVDHDRPKKNPNTGPSYQHPRTPGTNQTPSGPAPTPTPTGGRPEGVEESSSCGENKYAASALSSPGVRTRMDGLLDLQRGDGFEHGFIVGTQTMGLSDNFSSGLPDTIFDSDMLLPGGGPLVGSSTADMHFVLIHSHPGAPNYLSGNDYSFADINRLTVIAIDDAGNITCTPQFLLD